MSVSSPTLADIRAEVRMLLGEPQPVYWNESVLNYSINKGSQDMCSEAQSLETLIQFNWPYQAAGGVGLLSQEAVLPVDLDQIIWVGYYSGQFFQLEAFNSEDMIKVANKVSGIPIGFYTRTQAQVTSTQGGGATSGDVAVTNLNPTNLNTAPNPSALGQFIDGVPTATNPQTTTYSTMMGLWPIPLQSLDVTIACTRNHPQLVNDTDLVAVPPRYTDGLVGYTMWKAKLKQQAYDEAQIYKGFYDKHKMDMVQYYISHKQLKTFPTYGGTAWPTLCRGSSSVIFVDQSPGIIGR